MKKTILILMICFAFVMTASAKDYSDLKAVMTKMVDATEAFAKEANVVKDAAGAAKAIRNYTKNVTPIVEDMVKLPKKYPELEGMEKDPSKLPAELKDLGARMEKMQPMMQTAMMKIMAYGNDPEVQKATMEMQQVWMKMAAAAKKDKK